jgi:hypothetical protein
MRANLFWKGADLKMRNILMTVMLLMVVVLIFVNVVSSPGGLRSQIEQKGRDAITDIISLTP